jgi:AraC family transcriptional regulator
MFFTENRKRIVYTWKRKKTSLNFTDLVSFSVNSYPGRTFIIRHMNMKLCGGEFCGSLLNKREMSELILTEYTYPAELKLSRHEHEYAYFSLVLQGSYDETFGNQSRRTCKPSTVTLHPAGEQHADTFHRADGRIFSVEIEPKWMERANEFPELLSEPAAFHGGASTVLFSKIYGEFYRTDNVSHLAIEGLLLELTAEISRRRVHTSERKPPRWLENAKELVHEHFAEHLTLELIARQVGVHPVHLVREFRKHFRLTVGDYIRRRRIEYACRQLSESDIPLIEIALNAGFSQQSHFSRIFKAVTGMTPTAYRRKARTGR